MDSYIPEGGVWTAAERECCINGKWSGDAGTALGIAAETVSALIAALEESHKTDGRYHYTDGGQIPTGCPIHALLAAVKS